MKVTLKITSGSMSKYVLREELNEFKERLEDEYGCIVTVGRVE